MKTRDLIGAQLDWAVAKCEGYECEFGDEVSGPWLVPQEGYLHDEKPLASFRPSTDWAQGGPLSERESLCVGRKQQCDTAYCPINDPTVDCWARTSNGGHLSYGPTPLIAAMRCFCASRLGDEINIPEELK